MLGDVEHPTPIRPEDHALFSAEKMGKSTIFRSERLMVGLNAFEPGQEHALHAHREMDKVYHVLSGRGLCLLDDREVALEAGQMLVAPAGVPHGIRNTGDERLVVLAILAPSP
jgi:mannose-6-phosphate isomerase-like protein (cupin superfamily)